jgi:ribosomal protein S18 acetylase RimI-like enzyme
MAVFAVDSLRVAGGDLTVYIPDIGVSSARLRRGLGGALIAAAAERVRARGLEALVLIVDTEDVGGRDFFPKARL